jgi:hypothetical protein
MMFRGMLRKAIQTMQQGGDPKGTLREPSKAKRVVTSAGSVVRD